VPVIVSFDSVSFDSLMSQARSEARSCDKNLALVQPSVQVSPSRFIHANMRWTLCVAQHVWDHTAPVAKYLELNRVNWDDRVPAHIASADYAVQRFLDDPAFLSDAVRFDLPRLGDVSGLRGVHLQCHIGTDTISLARLGASMTGLDFSGAAVAEAARLAAATGIGASFVQADVYDAADMLGPGSFDLVYTGVGALTWLPDIRRWGRVVADLMRPGGPGTRLDGTKSFPETT
jgi:2-polyprenyl-3-methyl-5-hydroxy-6-metoxy-1,4-benzoquinol methylase